MPDLLTLDFMWPPLLGALILLPLVAWVYLRMNRSASMSMKAKRSRWHRHLPFVVVLLGLAVLLIAMARPQSIMLTPMREATVMLVIDTSGSMRANDVQPSRIDAAQAEAERFVLAKPARLRVGLVTIAGTAALAQAPTEQRDDLLKALDNLPLQYGSALGSGVLIALEALLPASGIDAQKIINEASDGARKKAEGQSLGATSKTENSAAAAQANGRAMAIVLLTDGQGNLGPELLEMAKLAAQHRVRIYTVGVGTPEGAVVQVQGRSMRVRLEEDALQQVARLTDGEYFRASSAKDLQKIYDQLGHRFKFEKRAVTEISGAMALLGMVLVLIGCLTSVHRYGRIV